MKNHLTVVATTFVAIVLASLVVEHLKNRKKKSVAAVSSQTPAALPQTTINTAS